MTAVDQTLFADRFEISGSIEDVNDARRRLVVERRQALTDDELWLRGVERATGDRVLIEVRAGGRAWPGNLEQEAIARCATRIASRFIVPVLHVGPGIVYAEPPLGLPRATFTLAEAAELTIQACEVVCALHAAGARPAGFDTRNLSIVRDHGHLEIRWLVPGDHLLAWIGDADTIIPAASVAKVVRGIASSVGVDAWRLLVFFRALVPPGGLESAGAPLLDTIARMTRDPSDGLPADVASLARLLLPLASPSVELVARVESLPAITTLPPLALDWDHLIAEGEVMLAAPEALASRRLRVAVGVPLAAACHQRASLAWARGDLVAALRDADRAVALDKHHLPHSITRAVLLDALGQRDEARHLLDEILEEFPSESPPDPDWYDEQHEYVDSARAHAARGLIALREKAFMEAERDLHRALELQALPLYAHGLGAARYALDDFAGAAVAELRSVEMAPDDTRYRWALVGSLRKLGRDADARRHAQEILRQEPHIATHHERFTRLFG